MEILTERLVLREYLPADLEAVHEYLGDPEVVRYLPWEPYTLEKSKSFIEKAMQRSKVEPRQRYELAVGLREDGRLIGGCKLRKVSELEAYIEYIYDKRYWGKGYATETALAIVGLGFKELGVHRVCATCGPKNIASQRVLKKIGMTLEGRFRENIIQRGKYRDSLLWAVLEQEWEKK